MHLSCNHLVDRQHILIVFPFVVKAIHELFRQKYPKPAFFPAGQHILQVRILDFSGIKGNPVIPDFQKKRLRVMPSFKPDFSLAMGVSVPNDVNTYFKQREFNNIKIFLRDREGCKVFFEECPDFVYLTKFTDNVKCIHAGILVSGNTGVFSHEILADGRCKVISFVLLFSLFSKLP